MCLQAPVSRNTLDIQRAFKHWLSVMMVPMPSPAAMTRQSGSLRLVSETILGLDLLHAKILTNLKDLVL